MYILIDDYLTCTLLEIYTYKKTVTIYTADSHSLLYTSYYFHYICILYSMSYIIEWFLYH